MNPVSLMPPVDYCPSCEGQKAERAAFQIGEARARKAEQQAATETAAGLDSSLATNPGAPDQPLSAEVAGGDSQKPTASAVQSLLAPDLAVQASLAGSGTERAAGDAASLQLRTAQAYRGA